MKGLRRPCFRCISWWDPESRETGGKKAKPEVKGHNIPSLKQTVQQRNTTLHHIHTAHIWPRICSHQTLRWHKQHPTVHNKQDQMTTAEQLCSAGQRHCGVFWAGSDGWSSPAIYQSHLSAVRREELWSNFTLPPGLRPARERERTRGRLILGLHVWESRARSCTKTWLPYRDLLGSPPRWPLGVPPPPKGHEEEDMEVHHGIASLFVWGKKSPCLQVFDTGQISQYKWTDDNWECLLSSWILLISSLLLALITLKSYGKFWNYSFSNLGGM